MKYRKIFSFLCAILFCLASINCSKDSGRKNNTTIDKTADTTRDKTKTTDTSGITNNDEIVIKIIKLREEDEKKLADKKLTKKEITIKQTKAAESTKQKWEKMDAYYDGDKLVRIQVYPHKNVSERTEEYYAIDGELVYVFIRDKVSGDREGKDKGLPGKEFYFDNGKVVKYINSSGEKSSDEETEKRMYETRLPMEFKELSEIAASSK